MKLQLNRGFDSKFWTKLVLRLAVVFVAAYLIIVLFFYFYQDDLLFFSQPIESESIAKINNDYKNVENIKIKTSDGNALSGWFVKNSKLEKSPLIIYFGGNAEEVSHLIYESDNVSGWSLALTNYRGYGLSTGKPNEKNLFSDALNIYNYYSKREDVDASKIVVMGRSVGTGVAVYLAANREVEKVILVTPYDSMISVAKNHYSFLPISLILRNRFDSISRVPHINVPMLALIADNDTTIPPQLAKRLVDKWRGKCTMQIIKGADHNSISQKILYWKYINEFLKY